MQCESVYLRISKSRISFLKFIIEGYDGLAILSTVDRTQCVVRLLVPVSRYNELFMLLSSLAVSKQLTVDAKH